MSKIHQLPKPIGAIRATEVKWANKQKMQSTAVRQWNELCPVASELLDETLDGMDYAFDEHPDLDRIVSDIRVGNTQADFIMDFDRTADLGRQNKAILEAINFDMAKIDQLAELGAKLGQLLGQADSSKLGTSEEKLIRDRAYTLLYKTIRKIRKCGKWVCRGEEERLKGYVSPYYRKKNARSRSSETETANQAS